jgi:hypothetical protein
MNQASDAQMGPQKQAQNASCSVTMQPTALEFCRLTPTPNGFSEFG